jgi:ADP-ribosylglycohydrolase
MNAKIRGAVYGSLIADAFSLGGHWIYDIKEIKESLPSLDSFYNPLSTYHNDKKAGDFTHYGDQSLWLLESLALEKEFSLSLFSLRWQEYMAQYNGYIDGASSATLEHFKQGKSAFEAGSSSQDLSVVGRIAPLALLYADNYSDFLSYALMQVKMTHNSVKVVAATQFFTDLLYRVLQGSSPKKALSEIEAKSENKLILNWIKIAFASIEFDTVDTIHSLGQSCSVNGGCPGAVHLILKYEDDYEEAMKQNVYAGGDSAARGMVAGMILGAHNGFESLPSSWLNSLNNKARIERYIGMIDA